MKLKTWQYLALGVVLVLVLGMGAYSCLMRMMPATARFEIVVEPGFTGRLRLVEDPSVRPGKYGVYVLRQKGDTILVPTGFVDGDFYPKHFAVTRILDTDGTILSTGNDPPKGKIGLRGYGVSHGPDPKTGKAFDGSYFTIGK